MTSHFPKGGFYPLPSPPWLRHWFHEHFLFMIMVTLSPLTYQWRTLLSIIYFFREEQKKIAVTLVPSNRDSPALKISKWK